MKRLALVSIICQKYVPIDLANPAKVIASEAKQSLRFSKRLLRRQAPRNHRLWEQILDTRYKGHAMYSNRPKGG
jgi:hypothetical protein